MFEFINDEEERGQVGIGTLIVFIAMVLVAAIAAGVLINTAGFLQTQAEETGQDSTDQVANNINVIGTVGSVNGDPKVEAIRLTVQKSAGAGDIDLSGLSIQYVGPKSFANLVHQSDFQDAGYTTQSSIPSSNKAYLVDTITAQTEGDNVLTGQGDRYELTIPLNYKPTSVITVTKDSDSSTVDVYNGKYLSALKRTQPTVEATGGSDGIDGEKYVPVKYVNWDNTGLNLLGESSEVELTVTTESGSQRYVTLKVPDSLVGDDSGTVQL